MLTSMAILAVHASTLAQDVDRCVAAHRSRKAASVSILVTVDTGGTSDVTAYRVQFVKPSAALLEIRRPETQDHGRTDVTFLVSGDRLVGVDRLTKQYLERFGKALTAKGHTGPAGLDLKLASVLHTMDDAVEVELDAAALSKFLTNFRHMDAWKNRSTRDEIVWRRDKVVRGKATTTILEFDRVTHFLRRMSVASGIGQLTWAMENGAAPKTVALAIPTGFRKVDGFVQEPALTTVMPGVKGMVQRASRAMGSLKHVALRLTTDEGSVSFWRSGRRVRSLDSRFEWTFDGKRLDVIDLRESTEWSCATTIVDLPDDLRRAGETLDPMLWRIAASRDGLHALLGAACKVRSMGTVGSGPRKATLVEVVDGGSRTVVEILDSSKLVRSMATTVSNSSGEVLEKSSRSIDYESVGRPIDADRLTMHASARTRKSLKR